MGHVKGLKKRKKTEKKFEENASGSGSSEKEGPVDWWDKFSRKINGFQSLTNGIDRFESIFKISRKTFDYICSLVHEDLKPRSAHFVFNNGKPLSMHDQVAIALRRLSSGDSLVTVGDLFGLNHSTVSQVTWRFVEAMEERALPHLQWPSTEAEMTKIKSKFHKIRGFPNCCGAVDTTHIMMVLPASEPTSNVWLDAENNHSMVLQVIVDPDMRFLDVVTGWPGTMKDWSVFQNSNFHQLCDRGERLNGKNLEFSKRLDVREYILGDAGFPLLPYLVTPYEGKELPEPKVQFNKRHYATQKVAQRALSRLKDKWRIIQGVMWRPDKNRLPRIILVCCLLHNIVIDMEDAVQDEKPLSNKHDPDYHQQICETVDKNGVHLREKLSLYLSGRMSMPP